MLTGAIFVKVHYDFPKGPTAMKQFLEEYGLNLLGDTIAGFLGLATFIVVVITYVAQRAQAKQTIKDIRTQNDLTASIANANLKLGLYEKRLSVYTAMREINQKVAENGTVGIDEVRDIFNAVDAAKFIYPQSVITYLEQVGSMADEILRLHFRISSRQRKMQLTTLTQQESDELDAWHDRQSDLEAELAPMTSFTRIDQQMGPHLTVPHEIVVNG